MGSSSSTEQPATEPSDEGAEKKNSKRFHKSPESKSDHKKPPESKSDHKKPLESKSDHKKSQQSQSVQPKKLKSPRVTILNEILREKVKLDENLEKENNAILKEFVETFIPVMRKQDKTFDKLFQRVYYTGSYYSDLRITEPNEYDLNLLLKLPFKAANVQVMHLSQVPSYVKYFIADTSGITNENGLTRLFENGYLIPNKVRVWIQSVVDKALSNYKSYPAKVVNIKCSGSGPARTIVLEKRNGVIDIDLVPAIKHTVTSAPPGIDGRVYGKLKDNLKVMQCFLVPKPYQPSKQAPVNAAEKDRLWRTHYPVAEDKIIHDLGCVKPVIKLLKLLRDKENWKILASYYLKTVVLWMVLENSNPDYWKSDQIGERFLNALESLAECVEQRKIRYFFSSRYNLLEKLSQAQAYSIRNRLRTIIRDIKNDDKKLWAVFDCQPTFSL